VAGTKSKGSSDEQARSSPEAGTHGDLESLLAGLGGTGELQLAIERRWPMPDGYLECIPIPDDFAPQQVLDYIRGRHGPGRYRLRPFGRNPDTGKKGYLRGASQISIAGVQEAPAGMSGGNLQQPVIIHERTPEFGGGMVAKLFDHLMRQRDPSEGLLKLFGTMVQTQTQQQQPRSSTTEMMQLLKLMREFESMRGGVQPEEQREPNMENMFMMMMMNKMMAGGEAPPPRPAQPQPQRRPDPPPRREPPPPPVAPTPAPKTTAAELHPDDDEEISLEDEVAEHLTDLAEQNPDEALAFVVQILDKLPPSVVARLQGMSQGGSEPSGQVLNLNFGGRRT